MGPRTTGLVPARKGEALMGDLARFQHPHFARIYERISAGSERRGTAACRDRALAGLSGRVMEVGAGHGMNFAHYPPTVSEVVAVEPDNRLRPGRRRRLARAGPGHGGGRPRR